MLSLRLLIQCLLIDLDVVVVVVVVTGVKQNRLLVLGLSMEFDKKTVPAETFQYSGSGINVTTTNVTRILVK